MKNIRKFETTADMDSAVLEDVSVSYVNENDKVYTISENGGQDVVDYSSQYLTFEAIEDSTFKLTRNACEYSLDEGETWTSLSGGTNTPTVSAGNKIMFKATNPSISESWGIGAFSSTGKFKVEGNIMSMLYGDYFVNKNDLSDKNFAFRNLFRDCTNVIEAHNLILPATMLSTYCYGNLFFMCSSLTTAPSFPATTLAKNCYTQMFRDCTSLTTAPELPATTLADNCYESMFEGCTSLTKAPELPATNMYVECYRTMFKGCTSLVKAPQLPATKLRYLCYNNMFLNCTSLTTAPELPATTLIDSCYSYMFYGCTSLNHITMLATDISASDCLSYWVGGVSPTGTFVKHPNMTSLPTGTSGIPKDWTVEDAVL